MFLRGATRGRVHTSAQLVSAGRITTTTPVNVCDEQYAAAPDIPELQETQLYKSPGENGEGSNEGQA